MNKRQIIIPGDVLSEDAGIAGDGTYVRDGKVYASLYGILSEHNKIKVVPLSGKYMPARGDIVIGIVKEVTFSNWIVDIGSPYDGLLHISEYPQRINSEDMSKHLKVGETILTQVKEFDPMMKVELTIRNRKLKTIRSGRIFELSPSKIPRLIGHGGSMISLIKKETNCSIIAGENGRVWIEGSDCNIDFAIDAITKIEQESHIPGLTNRLYDFFEGTKTQKNESDKEYEKESILDEILE
ncbi:MAG: S1 RNA-binding domain-containing protein [Methanosarcinales archaeon]|nr:MAG: S1 RNA-binding domain-containing protein [Methanosarcinales archaeon]